MRSVNVLLLVSFVAFARGSPLGQLDSDSGPPDYEYQSGQFLDEDEVFLRDYIPVSSKAKQLFLQGLIVEAGRHILFPKLYESSKVKQVNGNPIDRDEETGKVQYYEMKGQPELEQSYLNEKRTNDVCPRTCPVYKPVCGSDGKVYDSECHMRKENCRSRRSLTVTEWEKCQGKHYLCPDRCLDLNDPVCGSDGRIYHNICMLRKNNCGKLLEVMPVKKCYENTRQSKALEDCPEKCQDLYKPVCGSDGVIYFNECFMKKKTCSQNIVQVRMESCGVEASKCPEMCLPIFDPVCGSDGQLYINICRMLQETCGRDVKPVSRNACEPTKEISKSFLDTV